MAAYTTIDNPELYFQIKNYTGNGTDDTTITLDGSEDMTPAFVWIKKRNSAENHVLFDTARGATKYITADTNALEATDTGSLKAFTSDGFTLGTAGRSNNNTNLFVSYCWKGGTTSGITTTGSDVTPSAYTFDQTSKFSALKYAGNGNTDNQVAHGIGSKPDFMMVKNLDGSINSWAVFHKAAGNEKYFELDVTNAMADGVNRWQDTDPDTVNFTTGNSDTVNNSSYNYVCYAFSEVQGYSKFGSYVGNGNADGTFVYTGFKPKMLLAKSQSSGGGFYMIPSKTDWYNGDTYWIYPYSNTTESNAAFVDFHANGFKLRKNDDINNNNQTYIYAAFAEEPFVNSNGVPCTAR